MVTPQMRTAMYRCRLSSQPPHCHGRPPHTALSGKPTDRMLPLLKLHLKRYKAQSVLAVSSQQAAALQGGQSDLVARPCSKASLTLGKARSQQESLQEGGVGAASCLISPYTTAMQGQDQRLAVHVASNPSRMALLSCWCTGRPHSAFH